METIVQRYLPQYEPDQLFRIAADIEAYPDFLFWCQHTRIKRRDGNRMVVDNLFAVGPARARFETYAVFDPPWSIEIRSQDGPFERLHIAWRFEKADEGGTRVSLTIEQKLRGKVFEVAAKPFLRGIEDAVINAFVKRARAVLGTGGEIRPRYGW